ncbi:hypothetical protein MNODULE_02680 [Nitrospiraceae bacterium HYJII51-Mn-bac16s-1-B09]|uniref:Phosphate-selective porin O and P n=2 Tax=Candidatus Manganitrophus noduliformans TaxID=2606439 RepID=A0A7X6I9P8_9BACT|nr:hypothetical protein [Candidatus Manganitrophus noduliformans]
MEEKNQMIRYRLGRIFVFLGLLGILLSSLATGPSTAHAGGTIKIDDVRSVSVGMGLRTSFNMIEDAAPSGEDWSKDFALDNIRLYMSGQLHELITFEFNTEREQTSATTESIRVLDAVVKFGFNDYFNIWFGRFLPPSDRSNLDGPYYLNAWDFPFVQMYPAIFAGRDDGAAIWGMIGGGKFKYQVGAFDGTTGGPNEKDNLLYAGRLTLNLWDPEAGYYNSSTYYGSMNVLAIGLAAMTQKDAVGTAGASGDFTGWNVDLLVERNLGSAGVATLEGAYYDYDNEGLATEGDGYFALISYLLPGKVGGETLQGQLQPMVRYQRFENEGPATGDHSRLDVALSYIIDGHNARITLTYSQDDPAAAGAPDFDMIKLGLQFQI